MELKMVSRYSIYPREVLLKVSSRSNIWKFVKNPPILQVTSWSLGGKVCSWWSWRWCQGTQDIPGKFYWKFHQDPTSGSLSRLHLSARSPPVILEDLKVPDGTGVGVGGSSKPIETFPESLTMIWALDLWFWLDFELGLVVWWWWVGGGVASGLFMHRVKPWLNNCTISLVQWHHWMRRIEMYV